MQPNRKGMVAKRGVGVVMGLALVSGCSVVKAYPVRDDWATVDRAKGKRLVVVVQPLPDGQAKAGELFARIARRSVDMKRDFLVKRERAAATPPELTTPSRACCS